MDNEKEKLNNSMEKEQDEKEVVKFTLDQSFNSVSNSSEEINIQKTELLTNSSDTNESSALENNSKPVNDDETHNTNEINNPKILIENNDEIENEKSENNNDQVKSIKQQQQQQQQSSIIMNASQLNASIQTQSLNSKEFDQLKDLSGSSASSFDNFNSTSNINDSLNYQSINNSVQSVKISNNLSSATSVTNEAFSNLAYNEEKTKQKSIKDKDKNALNNSHQNKEGKVADALDDSKSKKSNKEKSKKPWYSVFINSYKQKNEDFKRLFKLPNEEHLLVDYSCALQREILAHGRLYVSSNYVCFRANIIGWETNLVLKLKEIRSINKDKTAKIIPNAITIALDNEKYFFTSFVSRDKTYTTLLKIWQIALADGSMSSEEIHNILKACYGEDLGYNSDDAEFEYYSKLKTKSFVDQVSASADHSRYLNNHTHSFLGENLLDLNGISNEKPFNSAYSSPYNLNINTNDLNSLSDDQSNIKMKKQKLSINSNTTAENSASATSLTPLSSNLYPLGHRHSSSYDASLIDTSENLGNGEVLIPVPNTTGVFLKRPKSMVVNKQSLSVPSTQMNKRHSKPSINPPISTSTTIESNLDSIQKLNDQDLSNELNITNDDENNQNSRQNDILITSPLNTNVTNFSTSSPIPNNQPQDQMSLSSSSSSSSIELSSLQDTTNLPDNVKCACSEHQGKEMLNQVLNISVNQLWESVFGHSVFCKKYWESRKFGNLKVGDWKLVDSSPTRILEYTVDLGAAIGRPKNTEEQKIIEYKPELCVVIESSSVTHGVPYSDYFTVINRFCMTRVNSTSSRLQVTSHLNYKQRPNFIVKSFIEKNTMGALKDSYNYLVNLINKDYLNSNNLCHEQTSFLTISNCINNMDSGITEENQIEKNLPDVKPISKRPVHISAINSETIKSKKFSNLNPLTNDQNENNNIREGKTSKSLNDNISKENIIKNQNNVVKKKRNKDSLADANNIDDSNLNNNNSNNQDHHHHHHHHHLTHNQLDNNSSINNNNQLQTQLVPIQKFSFFKWEINVDTLVRLFIIAMVFLMIINGMLYYKLRRIESLADSLKNDPNIIAKLNPSKQFERVLSDNTDEVNLNNWKSVVTNTLDAIAKMEKSLKQWDKKLSNRENMSEDL